MTAAEKCFHTVLTFFLGSERYAVPLSDVQEVNRLTNVRKVPKGPDYLIGVINLHGKTVPVLNLKTLLHLESTDLSPKTMWCAIQLGKSFVCIAVDRLSGFMKIADKDLDPVPEVAGTVPICCFRGYARDGETLMPILNIEGLLRNLSRETSGGIDAGDHCSEGKNRNTSEHEKNEQVQDERDQ